MERDSRASILAAASEEFAAYGLAGARVARIARHAGVNKQLLFYYFGSKAGLHQAVLEGIIEQAKTRPATGGPVLPTADARLEDVVRELFKALVAQPYLVRLSLEPADGRGSVAETLRFLSEPVRRVVMERQGVGLFRDDADPDLVASFALCAILGYVTTVAREGRPERDAAWIEGLADLLVRGLAW